jgi:class 3 adenylate cyclase
VNEGKDVTEIEITPEMIDAAMDYVDREWGGRVMPRAELAMLATLDQFNAGRRAASQQSIAIGIGINTGLLMLGTIGGPHRIDGTVISNAMILAARVESLPKEYKVPLLISEHCWRQFSDCKAYRPRARSLGRPASAAIVNSAVVVAGIATVRPGSILTACKKRDRDRGEQRGK